MKKKTVISSLWSVLFIGGAMIVLPGCQKDQPEVNASQYGHVVTELPNLSNRKDSFPLPEGVEPDDCTFKMRALKNSQAESGK